MGRRRKKVFHFNCLLAAQEDAADFQTIAAAAAALISRVCFHDKQCLCKNSKWRMGRVCGIYSRKMLHFFFSLKEPQRVEKPVSSSDIKTFRGFQRDKRKRDDVGPAHSPEVSYCLGLSHFVSFVSQAARNISRTHLFLWVSSI